MTFVWRILILMPSPIVAALLYIAVIDSAEHEKKRKYSLACQDRRATFTPLCMSVDGTIGCEATSFLKWVADQLSAKWNRAYASVMGWIWTRLSFAILCATLVCI